VVLRPRPRPTAGCDTRTTNRHDTQLAVQQVDPYAVTEIPCVSAPPHAGTPVSAVHSHSRDAPTRRRRPRTCSSGLFASVGWVAEWAPRTSFPTTKLEHATRLFTIHAAGAMDRWLRNGVWYAHRYCPTSRLHYFTRVNPLIKTNVSSVGRCRRIDRLVDVVSSLKAKCFFRCRFSHRGFPRHFTRYFDYCPKIPPTVCVMYKTLFIMNYDCYENKNSWYPPGFIDRQHDIKLLCSILNV